MTIGEKIKNARTSKQNNLTQKALGHLVGLSDVRIRQYELNSRTPKEGVLEKIAKSTGFSLQYFTDHSIETPIDAMHALFDLKQKYGLKIKKTTNEKGKQVYQMTIEDKDLDDRVRDWLASVEKKLQQVENGSLTIEDFENECQIWEGRYPVSLAVESEAIIKEARKAERNKKENE